MARQPTFLDLPPRPPKPRAQGLTHVLDNGVPISVVRSMLPVAGDFIDIWKLGWGTAYLDSHVSEKVSRLSDCGIRACVGGTLLEVSWRQGKAEDCLAWAFEANFTCVEVSNGAVGMPLQEKRSLIAKAADRFTVVAEVGSKDPSAPVNPTEWAEEMSGDLRAGATWVIAEGRESGTVGLYRPDGGVREQVVEAILSSVGDAVIFEAPRKDQQAWFIGHLGCNVSLGNVVPSEVLGVEALRLGLRADTLRAAASSQAGEMRAPR
jgi:phosphosulfolactate synthase